MLIAFYILAAILVWLSFKSFRGGVAYLKYFRDELANPASDYTPFVSVIVPCRGLENGLADNLTAVLKQDYPNFEVIFVVDDESDPSVTVIDQLRSTDARLVVANKALDSGQKVENLREAVTHLSPDCEVVVFTDSDARPRKDWLRRLVAPLQEMDVGASTGYRWFVSEQPTFASEMRSVWNASIASALGPNRRSNFCWGGSTAIRRETFERLNIRDELKGTLSDDFTVTRVIRNAGLDIVFVPQALNASVGDCTFRELIEFTNRQMKITRVYATPLWLMTLFGTGLFNLVMIAAIGIVLLSRTNSLAVWVSIATILLVSLFSIGKAWLRSKAVKLALSDQADAIKRQSLTQNTLWLVSPALFFINSVAALLSRRITWRGIGYELKSPTETVIIAPNNAGHL